MSVIKFSTFPAFTSLVRLGCGGCGLLRSRLSLNALVKPLLTIFGVIIIYAVDSLHYEVLLLTVLSGTTLDILTSNQARLPAELKHINKRRKRN